MTLKARYKTAQLKAKERLSNANEIQIHSAHQNADESFALSKAINKIDQDLIQSFKVLQSLHAEWESLIDDLRQDDEAKAKAEQDLLDKEFEHEDGFTSLYQKIGDAQKHIAEALEFCLKENEAFYAESKQPSATESDQQRELAEAFARQNLNDDTQNQLPFAERHVSFNLPPLQNFGSVYSRNITGQITPFTGPFSKPVSYSQQQLVTPPQGATSQQVPSATVSPAPSAPNLQQPVASNPPYPVVQTQQLKPPPAISLSTVNPTTNNPQPQINIGFTQPSGTQQQPLAPSPYPQIQQSFGLPTTMQSQNTLNQPSISQIVQPTLQQQQALNPTAVPGPMFNPTFNMPFYPPQMPVNIATTPPLTWYSTLPQPAQTAGTTMPQPPQGNYFQQLPINQMPQQHLQFNVPKLEPPKFDGSPAKFRQFWQLFQFIHQNPTISPTEKMACLLSCLTGEAKQAFAGYDICDLNYQPVIDELHRRFGQTYQILTALYKQYDDVKFANTINDISKAVNFMESCLRQLQAMGVQTEDMGLQQSYVKKLPNWFKRKVYAFGVPSSFAHLRALVLQNIQTEMQFMPQQKETQTHQANVTVAQVDKRKEKENYPKTVKVLSCIFCKGSHFSSECTKFTTYEQRKANLEKQNRCLRCCRLGHETKKCNFKWLCGKCKGNHHRALCFEKTAKKITVNAIKLEKDASKEIAMPIATATVRNPQNNESATIKILLDSASASTFIREKLARKLNLPIVAEALLEISRFGDSESSPEIIHVQCDIVMFHIIDEDKNIIDIEAYSIKNLTQALPAVNEKDFTKTFILPDVLLGNDNFSKVVKMEQLPNGFSKLPTKLGPVIYGSGTFVNTCSTKLVTDEFAEAKLGIPKFWSTENFSTDDYADDWVLQHFLSHAKIVNGRIEVELPFIKDPSTLPSNKQFALKCLMSLLKRLAAKPEKLKAYHTNMINMLAQSMIEPVPLDEADLQGHVLSHHCVLTPGKSTVLRIVFNCSGKASKTSPSFNEYMPAGPALMPTIIEVLLRLRMLPILVVGDVEKAFLQLSITPKHRKFVRFFWIKDPERYIQNGFESDNLVLLQFSRVLFGAVISPFFMNAANAVLFDSMQNKSLGTELKGCTYVDNSGIGAQTAAEAIQKTEETISAYASVQMNFRDIMSNSPTVREHFGVQATTVSLLGLKWDPETDNLSMNLTAQNKNPNIVTKRTITAEIGKKYDPHGFAAPVILRYKAFLQKLWMLQTDWDDRLSPEISDQWREMLQEDIMLNIPRLAGLKFESAITEIHGFCDASRAGYATVIYLMHKNKENSEIQIQFLISKTKVAPLKDFSVPRLELLAAVLGAQLIQFIKRTLPNLQNAEAYLWTDSSAVFYWLQSKKSLKRFVHNRVELIKSSDFQIRHVPTKDNPADIASRGCSMSELRNHQLWFKAPPWLKEDKSLWPAIIQASEKIESEDVIKEVVLTVIPKVQKPPELIYSSNDTTSWSKLVRVLATCMKFDKICRKKTIPGPLTANEIQAAENYIVKTLQQQYPPSPHTCKNLAIIRDENELLRVKSRLQHCSSSDLANPVYLPDSPETRLLILFKHQQLLHVGPKSTLTELRQTFWIPKGLSVVKSALGKCRGCLRYRAKPYLLPLMPNFPSSRVNQHGPFKCIGIDAAGPWKLKGPDETKRWVLLITCFVTRAVYLDILYDMSAKACINAFIRFMGTYSTPEIVLSDNAGNFKATAATVTTWNQVIRDPELLNYAANLKITWENITERAAWKGGLYERMVGLTKSSLKHGIGRKKLTDEDLLTLVKQVQGIVNSRPLVQLDPEKEPLRPIDFLLPKAKLGLPQIENDDDENDPSFMVKPTTAEKLIENLRKSNICLNRLWQRWIKEYLTHLRETSALLHKQKGLDVIPKVDDVVIIEEEDMPRGCWKLGRITDVHASSDGEIRAATVKTPNGNLLKRSPAHLYPLEANLEPGKSNYTTRGIHPVYLTLLLFALFHSTTATPIIKSITCIGHQLNATLFDVNKLLLKLPHRANAFDVNHTDFNIILPDELAITGGHITVTAYSNEGLVAQQQIECVSVNLCSFIECYFCSSMLKNYHCWSWWIWIIFAIILFFIVWLPLRLFRKADTSLFVAGAAHLWRKTFIKRNRYEFGRTNIPPENPEIEQSQSNVTEPVLVTNQSRTHSPPPKSKEYVRRVSHLAVGMALVFFCLIPSAKSCSKSVVIQGNKESCYASENGYVKCQYSQQDLITAHSEAEICLLFQYEQMPIMTLTIQTVVRATCLKTPEYTTAMDDIDVVSYKHCPGVGPCKGEYCANVKKDDKLPELYGGNSYPGITSCMESCGSLTCGCVLPGTGCTFFRYFMKTKKPDMHIFSCPKWTPEVHFVVKYQGSAFSNKPAANHTFLLYEGGEFKKDNISFHLKRLTLPFFETFDNEISFIQQGQRLAWINKKAMQQATLLKCYDEEECALDPNACRCWPADSTVGCTCQSQHELKNQWKSNQLPSLIGQNLVSAGKKLIPHLQLHAVFDLVIETSGIKTSEVITNAACKVQDIVLTGRVGPEGALLNITCIATYGQCLGHIECLAQAFYVKCTQYGTRTLHRWYSSAKEVREECIVKCFNTSTKFEVKATLASMDHDNSWPFLHGNATNNPSITEHLAHAFEFVYARILYVIVGIAVIMIMVVLLK